MIFCDKKPPTGRFPLLAFIKKYLPANIDALGDAAMNGCKQVAYLRGCRG